MLATWLEYLAAVVFAAVALVHLGHLLRTEQQRRSWHACHVLMAAAMVGMYVPGATMALPWLSDLSEATLALAGLLAAGWAWWGTPGAVNPVWLLTALDLGAMTIMFAPDVAPALGWAVVVYLAADAVLWALDAVRTLDGSGSRLLAWLVADVDAGGATLLLPSRSVRTDGAGGLLGDLDISPSMVLMCLGMVTMAVTMRLAG